MRKSPLGITPAERFFAKVEFGENHYEGTRCLLWTGSKNSGYGTFRVAERVSPVRAHRWLYERWVGPIPKGLQIDHLCHQPDQCAGGSDCSHRACVNPLHLQPATHLENTLRGNGPPAINARAEFCLNGHEFTRENTYLHLGRTGREQRRCRICQRAREKKARG